MKTKIGVLLMGSVLLSGCAQLEAMQQEWIKENCNAPAAYNAGMRDGLRQGAEPYNFASSCPTNQVAINRAYNRGFSEGLSARPKQVIVEKRVIETVKVKAPAAAPQANANANKPNPHANDKPGKSHGRKHKLLVELEKAIRVA